jgi:small-conductance mechanosensitive channel
VLTGIAFALGAFLCARAIIRLVALLVTSSLAHVNEAERHRIEREYVPLAEKVTTLAVALVYVIVVAKHFGKDVSSLVAALGVGSLAIGLAAQQTLGNMIAGFVLLVDRPFRPGERIKLATGEVGEVRDIGVRSTRIRLLDGNLLVVPNSELANSRVVNFAVLTTHADIRILLAHTADVDRAVELLQAVVASDERARAVFVRVTNVSQHGIEVTLGFDAATPGDAAVAEAELRRRALSKLRAEKIPVPDAYRSSQGVPSGSPV